MTTISSLSEEPLHVLWNDEYIGITFADRDLRIWVEAWPFEGDPGPVYFRYGTNPYALACKRHSETWEAFFARLNQDWVAFPLIQRLAQPFRERAGK